MISRRKFNTIIASGLAACAFPKIPTNAANKSTLHKKIKRQYTGVWTKKAIPPYPDGIGMKRDGSKHTRWAYREITGHWYVNGGDYYQPGEKHQVYESGSNNTWKVDLKNNIWERVQEYWPKEGQIIPSHPDETVFVYDTKRDIFWHGAGYQWQPFYPGKNREETPTPKYLQDRLIYRHWMSFNPKTNKWQDHGILKNKEIHIGKFGYHDNIKDQVLIPYYGAGGNNIAVYDCSSGQWLPIIKPSGKAILNLGNDYGAFDKTRRRILFLNSEDFSVYYYDIDKKGFYEINTDNRPPPRKTNTYGLTYHAGLDIYALHGGTLKSNGKLTNDLWVLPAKGSEWYEVKMSGDAPSNNRNQVLIYDPDMDMLISFGGVGGHSDGAYFTAMITNS